MVSEIQKKLLSEGVKPRGEWVLIQKPRIPTKLVVVGDSKHQLGSEAIVVAVGEGKRLEDGSTHPIDLQPGETVYVIGDQAMQPPEMRDEALAIIHESAILARVKPGFETWRKDIPIA